MGREKGRGWEIVYDIAGLNSFTWILGGLLLSGMVAIARDGVHVSWKIDSYENAIGGHEHMLVYKVQFSSLILSSTKFLGRLYYSLQTLQRFHETSQKISYHAQDPKQKKDCSHQSHDEHDERLISLDTL